MIEMFSWCSRLGSPRVTMNSKILFMAPMKKMTRSWVIAIVMMVHRKIGEHTDRWKGGDPAVAKKNWWQHYLIIKVIILWCFHRLCLWDLPWLWAAVPSLGASSVEGCCLLTSCSLGVSWEKELSSDIFWSTTSLLNFTIVLWNKCMYSFTTIDTIVCECILWMLYNLIVIFWCHGSKVWGECY